MILFDFRGLDDLSSSQCVQLLKMLASGGRTIICSVHTPSARLFSKFDHVYIVSQGMCVFQGVGQDIVPFLKTINLTCPTTYNPADFSKFSQYHLLIINERKSTDNEYVDEKLNKIVCMWKYREITKQLKRGIPH